MMMKKIARFVVVLALLIGFTGCPEEPEPIAVDLERDRISEVIDSFLQALEEKNWEAFRETVHQEWRYFSPTGAISTLDEYTQIFDEIITDFSVELDDLSIHISGDGTMAWTTSVSETHYLVEEDYIEEHGLDTAVLVQENGQWLIIHLHRSVRPEE